MRLSTKYADNDEKFISRNTTGSVQLALSHTFSISFFFYARETHITYNPRVLALPTGNFQAPHLHVQGAHL